MKTLVFDVMLNGRFVCTLRMKYCPLFPLTVDEICEFVESKRPTLKGKKYRTVVRPTMLYGSESFPVSKSHEGQLHFAEMRMRR